MSPAAPNDARSLTTPTRTLCPPVPKPLGLGIPKNLPQANKDAAYHLITYLTSKDFEKYQVMTYETDPNRSSTGTDAEIVAALPYIPEGVKAIEKAQTLEIANIPEALEIAGNFAREIHLA